MNRASSREINEKAFLSLLERDPEAGLMSKTQLAARLAITSRQVDYLLDHLRAERIIARDQDGCFYVVPPGAPALQIEIARPAHKPSRPKLPVRKSSELGPVPGRRCRDRKYPPLASNIVVVDKPLAPPVLMHDQQRELLGRVRQEAEAGDAAIEERIQRKAEAQQAKPEARVPAYKQREMCWVCADLPHRRKPGRRCECGGYYKPEQIRLEVYTQSSLASCGD